MIMSICNEQEYKNALVPPPPFEVVVLMVILLVVTHAIPRSLSTC